MSEISFLLQAGTIQILADEGGIVGYVEGLKKKGLVKESFQVPSLVNFWFLISNKIIGREKGKSGKKNC